MNSIEHKEYIKGFTEKCELEGGVIKIPKGVKGWPKPSCINPDYMIDVS